ncbi:hypothetical protein BpHYR1_004344 [Brachionus plicatilis]|uniref:Uncharacterized protein n=1 Tax=Brachionus plicatilis TaxID=10195 RepID=A0A3M7RFN8_BRAPC|nr:hypothetical protein BpHYR1_004344 [Brachionus plicatilis]
MKQVSFHSSPNTCCCQWHPKKSKIKHRSMAMAIIPSSAKTLQFIAWFKQVFTFCTKISHCLNNFTLSTWQARSALKQLTKNEVISLKNL